jgi:hypothetical protein
METIQIEILNPKVKKLLKDLVSLNLISIKKEATFLDTITSLREVNSNTPSLDEIALEVKKVRRKKND